MRQPRVKEQTVTLVTPSGQSQVFGLAHAERLLDLGPECNGGWKIADSEKYIYTEEYGIRLKSDKTDSAKA